MPAIKSHGVARLLGRASEGAGLVHLDDAVSSQVLGSGSCAWRRMMRAASLHGARLFDRR